VTLEIRNPKDFWAGVLYMGIGLAALWIAQDYSMGSAGRMGPGYFPLHVSGALAIVGFLSLVRSFYVRGEPVQHLALKKLAWVTLAIVLFGVLVRDVGLVIALPLLTLMTAYASYYFRLVPMVLVAAALTLFCILVFFKALGIPLPLWGTWLGGG
jgi:hypothetical protein